HLNMDPRDFLYFGDRLIERLKRSEFLHGLGHAECRSVISRAYYASFLVAHNLLEHLGFWITETGYCHVTVQHGLNNSDDNDLKEAYQHLGTLYEERRFADYKLNNPRTEDVQQAEDLVRLAWDVIIRLDGCKRACASDRNRRDHICKK